MIELNNLTRTQLEDMIFSDNATPDTAWEARCEIVRRKNRLLEFDKLYRLRDGELYPHEYDEMNLIQDLNSK